jgi:hypothetical protein
LVEVADVRRRVRLRITEARQAAAARRAEVDAAERDVVSFLNEVAGPVFQMFAQALTAESYPFKVSTPAGALRLTPERSRSDFIEIELDTALDPPQVIGRVNYTRGSRGVAIERPIRENAAVADLTQDDVLDFLAAEIGPFVEK